MYCGSTTLLKRKPNCSRSSTGVKNKIQISYQKGIFCGMFLRIMHYPMSTRYNLLYFDHHKLHIRYGKEYILLVSRLQMILMDSSKHKSGRTEKKSHEIKSTD